MFILIFLLAFRHAHNCDKVSHGTHAIFATYMTLDGKSLMVSAWGTVFLLQHVGRTWVCSRRFFFFFMFLLFKVFSKQSVLIVYILNEFLGPWLRTWFTQVHKCRSYIRSISHIVVFFSVTPKKSWHEISLSVASRGHFSRKKKEKADPIRLG